MSLIHNRLPEHARKFVDVKCRFNEVLIAIVGEAGNVFDVGAALYR